MQAIAAKGGNMQQVDGVKLFPVLNMLNTKYFIFLFKWCNNPIEEYLCAG